MSHKNGGEEEAPYTYLSWADKEERENIIEELSKIKYEDCYDD